MSPRKANPAITATEVADNKRLDFLPRVFGERHMMRAESLLFAWARQLSQDYTGGYWHFYDLSNGGFYMAPQRDELFSVLVEGNFFEGELSADAFGIVVTLFVIGQLVGETMDEDLSEAYYAVRNYASEHAEREAILNAID